MVFGEAIAGAAAGAHSLWGYNRENFLFDRKMRAENEYKILEWRSTQAELWRNDVRDIIGLTEKKMDNYLIVATLQLGMSVGLFTEGRLEPGTPPWLLHFYMLTLGAAFMYLLMAVWLAMHASIVASCSSVRLLTQFVRLPVPTWEQIEQMRTYASSYESLEAGHMLRVPFTGKPPQPAGAGAEEPSGASSSAPPAPRPKGAGGSADPWGLEMHGARRELYELQESPAAMRRHIGLAKKAARQYQCFDAFARVAMSFGTNQLLMAIGYYCLGYVDVQDGAPWPAWCIVCIMTAIAVALVHLDFSLTRREQLLASALNFTGPAAASAVTWAWVVYGARAEPLMMTLLPIAYASHGLWLIFALVCCGLEKQPNGSVLPVRFRAVLYLDVFGWLSKAEDAAGEAEARGKARAKAQAGLTKGGYRALPLQGEGLSPKAAEAMAGKPLGSERSAAPSHQELSAMKEELRRDAQTWKSEKVQSFMEDHERQRLEKLLGRMDSLESVASTPCHSSSMTESPTERTQPESEPSERRMLKLKTFTDFGTEVPYLLDPESGETHVCEEFGAGGLEQAPDAEASSRIPDIHRGISEVEEQVEQYCSHRALYKQARAADFARGLEARTACAGTKATSPKPDGHQVFLDSVGRTVACTARLALDVLDEEEETGELRYSAGQESAYGRTAPNPAGEVQDSPEHIFHPQSYVPWEEPPTEECDDIVTGHDTMHPGKLPAKIFRLGTLLLVAGWAVGVLMPFGSFREFVNKPLMQDVVVEEMGPNGREREERLRAVMGTSPDGLPELMPEYVSRADLPSLPEGSLLDVDWPMHTGFVPRALSSDPTGTMFVVADDLGVYAGRLARGTASIADVAGAASSAGSAMAVAARGLLEASPQKVSGSVRFQHVPPCSALEGQALKDVSVVCGGDMFDDCRVVVLHARGRRLAECPLARADPVAKPRGLEGGMSALKVEPKMTPTAAPAVTWKISTDWLGSEKKKDELVNSVAVNSDCLSEEESSGRHFRPDGLGCVVVGTTEGRIVQLRTAFSGKRRLVPERAVEQRPRAVVPGSLHMLPTGFLMALRHSSGTVQAFDVKEGVAVGEWTLPRGIQWLTLCGSTDSLFVLGLRNGTFVELHRFPLPADLAKESVVQPWLQQHRTWRLAGGLPEPVGKAVRGSVEEM